MANVTPSVVKSNDGWWVATWESAALNDADQAGLPVSPPALANGAVVQAIGAFGNDGSVTLQGSNDGTNWATLLDIGANAITFTAAGIKQLTVIPRFIRVLQTEGEAAVTDVDIILAGQYFR